MYSHEEMIRRADLALADLTVAGAGGGLLNPEQQNRFIRLVIDQPTLIREVRTVPMGAPTMKINKIKFGSRILRAAPQGGPLDERETTSGANDGRRLFAGDRVKPDLDQIELTTKEVIAEVHIPDEVLEDNIERDNFADTIVVLIAERAALDLEELLIQGDTASADAYLALQDGVLKRATLNVVDNQNAGPSVGMFNTVKKALPTRYRRNLAALRHYTSMDVESDYRVQVASRGTDLGDAVLTGNAPLPVLGTPLRGVALMPDANEIFTNPQNVIWGIQRNVRIERARDIRSRGWTVVLTARIAIQIEEVEAVVKVINLQ